MTNQDDVLIEIGLEEMPARFVTDAMNQLKEKTTAWLDEQQVPFGAVEAFSTPRRLAVRMTAVADKQKDRREESRGPAKNIAVDDEGNWTKAALGFARGQGVSPDELTFREIKGKDYLFADQLIKGRYTIDLLPSLQNVIKNLSFPKSMRWNSYDLRFVRPIRWLLALYGDQVIPFSLTDVHTNHKTYGHRFLGEEIRIDNPADYKESLLAQHVIVDPEERKQAIRDQLQTLSEEEGWHIRVEEDLLEEVNNLVEYPTALFGTFDEHFLELPKEVLVISMSEHQRYFSVENENGDLLPYFVTIRNGDHQHLQTVARGNEKVLRARLSDARFFWDEDRKITIDESLKRLNHIVFLEELGSMGAKAERILELAKTVADVLGIDGETLKMVDRAAQICKFDLVTHMVDEFSELQGVIGEKYANLDGESKEVARAVNEHYQPRYKGDFLPEGDIGAVVGIADKLDTIIGCFVVGKIPSGSEDPYGLRRSASGIVQILFERGWDFSLEALIDIALGVYETRGLLRQNHAELRKGLDQFFRLRMKTFLQDRGVRYDVIDAVLAAEPAAVGYLAAKADLLMQKREEPEFKAFVEALSRVTHISAKADYQETDVDPGLFEHDAEKHLYEATSRVYPEIKAAAEERQPARAYDALSSLQEPINDYFDHIMVMAEDEHLKRNRLKQMNALSDIIRSFADFSAIVL